MYNNVVVPVDGSELAECVLPHLESLAKSHGTKIVTFVRTVEPSLPPMSKYDAYDDDFIDPEMFKRLMEAAKTEANNYLRVLTGRVKLGSAEVKTAVLLGRAAERIAEYARDNKADLIIMATHGRSGVARWVIGSVADRVLHISPVPVLVIRAPGCG